MVKNTTLIGMEQVHNNNNNNNNISLGTRHKRKEQRIWATIGLFISMLVIMLPFYSANVLATSLSITNNAGSDGYSGFIDAQSDTWSVDAQITGYSQNVVPEQVQLEVGSSHVPFSSCSGNSCTFLSSLENGIGEGSYPFRVVLYELESSTTANNQTSTTLGDELASDSDIIKADGSAPNIQFNSAVQEGETIRLDFEVIDQPQVCIGLEKVDVIDSDSGTILQTIDGIQNSCTFDYASEGGTLGLIPISFEGEGKRYIKIRATDIFGHSKTTSAKQIDTDFVVPRVVSESLSLPSLGSFVGTNTQTTDVHVNVTECDNLKKVTATSSTIEFFSQDAICAPVDASQCLFQCSWSDVQVTPSGNSISAAITMVDDTNNVGQGTVTKSFVADTTAPEIVSFGSEYIYDGRSYIAAGETTTIYLVLDEDGSGITTQNVAANLAAIGGNEFQNPDECKQSTLSSSNIICTWDITAPHLESTQTKEINIRFLEDGVGNQGVLLSKEIVVDASAPIVHDIELYGFSAVGAKNYFQSNDDVVVEFSASEVSGLVIYVDANDIVMDAENIFHHGETIDGEYIASDMDGWAKFVGEDVCTRDIETEMWDCELRVNSIKSGHDSSAAIVVDVRDTAGNSATSWIEDEESGTDAQNVVDGSAGKYNIEIFALDEETQPDFWELQQAQPSSDAMFVDLDVSSLAKTRMFMNVKFDTDSSAQALKLELADCQSEDGAGPTLARSLLTTNVAGVAQSNPTGTVILEFEMFDGNSIAELSDLDENEAFTKVELPYLCTFNIYSLVDDTALNYGEVQEAVIDVPFAYSQQGALDENIDEYLYNIAHTKGFEILDTIKILGKIAQWVRYLTPAVTSLVSIINIITALEAGQDSLRATAPGYAAATSLCTIQQSAVKPPVSEIVQKISPFVEVFTCNPSPGPTSWYGQYQGAVLEFFNALKGGTLTSFGGVTLYDNIWLSIAGLCIPGVVYNLEKLRQVYCTQAKCLMVDVPAGVTTVKGCQAAFDVLSCKYWWGELFGSFIPLTGIGEFLVNSIKAFVSNPLGLINTLVTIVCGIAFCATQGTGGVLAGFCDYAGIVFRFVDIIGNIVGMVQAYPSVTYDLCKEIEFDRHYGESEEAPQSVTTSDITNTNENADTTVGDDGAVA